MNWKVPEQTLVEALWDVVRITLVVCSFFWFGWQVGLLMIIMAIEIK